MRLSHLDPYAGFDVAPGPHPDWWVLDGSELKLDGWMTLLVRRHGHRATAGSMLGDALVRAVVHPTVSALVLERRCPDPAASNVAVRLDEAGDFARAAILRPHVAVLAGDPAAGDPDSIVVDDLPDLVAWWARHTAATLAPLLSRVRARAPFGLPALWGNVADAVTSITLWIGQLAGQDPCALWAFSQRLVEALAAHAPVRLARPRPFPVVDPMGEQWYQVRGTCCLSYRSALGEGFCSTCPLRDDESRTGLLIRVA